MVMEAEFIVDVASPNAYLAHKVLPSIEERTHVEFTHTPVLLGGIFKATNNLSPLVKNADVQNKLDYERLELLRFVKKYAVPFEWNPHFPVNSLLLMRVVTAAWLDGNLRAVLAAAMHHMWEVPKKMDDEAVVRAAFMESGFDADKLLRRAREQDSKDALIKNTQAAVARGAFGLPTFFVNGAMFFGKDRLRDVEDEVRRGILRA
jgi:2-hydroxychromene-2-carboxylate isomerase